MSTFIPIGSQCNNPSCRELFIEKVSRCQFCESSGIKPIYDFYVVLNVSHTFSLEELRSQYKKLSLKHHPDVNSGEQEQFLIVKQAYESLQQPQTRQEHDFCLQQIRQIRQGCFRKNYTKREEPFIVWEDFSQPFYEEVKRIQKIRHTCGVLGSILGICYSILSGGSVIMWCIFGYMFGSFYPQIGKLLLLLCNIFVFLIAVQFSLIALQTRTLLLLPVIILAVHWYIKNIPRWETELE